MDILKFSPYKKNTIIPIGIAVGIFGAIAFLYLSLLNELSNKAGEWKSLKKQLDYGYTNLKIFQRNGVNKKLISQKESSLIIDAMAREGRKLSLDLKSISRREPLNSGNGYTALPVELAIEGDYKQIGLFFKALEELKDALVTVDSFQMAGDERIAPKLLFSMIVTIYMANE